MSHFPTGAPWDHLLNQQRALESSTQALLLGESELKWGKSGKGDEFGFQHVPSTVLGP